MYVRVFAETSESPAGLLALSYVRAIHRFAPVRLVGMGSPMLRGAWASLAGLLLTPMDDRVQHGHKWINVVATGPDHWRRQMTVAMPKRDVKPADLAAGAFATGGADLERAVQSIELYTAGVRNVLIPCGAWTLAQINGALKYEDVIIPPSLAQTPAGAQIRAEWIIDADEPHKVRASILGLPQPPL